MGRFLIVGALAWDRPIWLSGAVRPGARLFGRSLGGALEGRLGGGGANAAVALIAAGHEAAVAARVPEGEAGDQILAAAAGAGIDTRFVQRGAAFLKSTWILIDPAGERVILGLDAHAGVSPFAPWGEDALAAMAAYQPDGIYLRGGGFAFAEALATACAGPVIAHLPGEAPSLAAATILVGSRADVALAAEERPLAAARRAGGARATWAILTDGGAAVIADDGAALHAAVPPQMKAIDATGAGDVFAAGLMEALAAGAAMPAALAHACVWGAAQAGLSCSAPVGATAAEFPPFRLTAP